MIKKLILILLISSAACAATRQINFFIPDDIDTVYTSVYNSNKTTIAASLVAAKSTIDTSQTPKWKTVTLEDTTSWRVVALAHYTGDDNGNYYTIHNQNYDYMLYNVTATASLSGVGTDVFYIYVQDTITTLFVPNVPVFLYTLGGTKTYVAWTDINGRAEFNLTVGDSIIMKASPAGYSFRNTDTAVVAVAGDDDTLYGSTVVIGSPGSASLCRVYGDLSNLTGDDIANYTISFSIKGRVNNICDSTIIMPFTVMAKTDASGHFEADLITSACLSGAKYEMKILGAESIWPARLITVTSTSSMEIVFH